MFGANKSLRFRVDMGVNRSLHRGINVKMDGKSICIKLKCVKLLDFLLWVWEAKSCS